MIPAGLRDWIATHMPDVGPVERVRIKPCRRMPFSWIPGNGKMDGLTLWRTIYLKDHFWAPDALNRGAIELLFHELTHVEQFRRNPLRFPVRYLIDHFRFG